MTFSFRVDIPISLVLQKVALSFQLIQSEHLLLVHEWEWELDHVFF